MAALSSRRPASVKEPAQEAPYRQLRCGKQQARRIGVAGQVWSYDFKFDQTDDTRPLKILTVMDEFTRRALTTHVARSIKAVDVIDQLAPLVAKHGAPMFMRSDNGPEFIAAKVVTWLEGQGSGAAFIESFHSRLEEELLAGEIF